jgi:cleavage stimulation factor subunit 2
MAEKHDVFVGNVTFNTTEEQLQEIFSFVGPIKNIRILTDQNTGRPKGFAFIEYSDANTALAAIRHLDGHELNNRKLRVSYSNNSNLKEIARSIGQVIPDIYQSHISTKQEYQAGKGWRRNIVCRVVVFRFEDESSIKCSILLSLHNLPVKDFNYIFFYDLYIIKRNLWRIRMTAPQ